MFNFLSFSKSGKDKIDSKEIEKAQKFYKDTGVEKAITTSINQSLGKAKTKLKKKITQEYYIKSYNIEKTLSVEKANYTLRNNMCEELKKNSFTKLKLKKI